VTVRLTSRDHELLLDLKEQGAALAEDLRQWFPSSSALRMRLVQLVRARYVEVVGHHHGHRIFALGPGGKRYLGIHSNWRTRPQEAVRQAVWRQCHAQLVAEGYRRMGPWHGGLVLYRKPSSPALAVQVFDTRPSARHVRKLLRQILPELIREGAVLCLFSPHTLVFQRSRSRLSSLPWWRPLPVQVDGGCE
jgi:hypothetical protein